MKFESRVMTWIWMLIPNQIFVSWKTVKLEDVNYYEEYLGTREEQAAEQSGERDEARVPKRGKGNVSTVIVNHRGMTDVVALIASPLNTGFAAKSEFRTTPCFNQCINARQSIYLDRGIGEDAQQKQIEIIKDRQNRCEEGEDWNPITIFPEGSTTNGTHIAKFKRGAFLSMRTIQPCVVKVTDGMVNHAWECLPYAYFLVLSVCSMSWYSCKVYMLPEFTPNMIMLEKHADKGSEDWEIYAECIRDAMAKYSKMPMTNDPLRNKLKYESFML